MRRHFGRGSNGILSSPRVSIDVIVVNRLELIIRRLCRAAFSSRNFRRVPRYRAHFYHGYLLMAGRTLRPQRNARFTIFVLIFSVSRPSGRSEDLQGNHLRALRCQFRHVLMVNVIRCLI